MIFKVYLDTISKYKSSNSNIQWLILENNISELYKLCQAPSIYYGFDYFLIFKFVLDIAFEDNCKITCDSEINPIQLKLEKMTTIVVNLFNNLGSYTFKL